MFKEINRYGMIKNGTIAVITMFGVAMLFGMTNIMLAYPIALTSVVLGRQNFRVKTYYKVLIITLIDIIIVTLAFISGLNAISGIVINFITIFLIVYAITTPYDIGFYRPFIMIYIFTQYSWVPLSELPTRYLSIIFGVSVIVICNKIINEVNEKSLLGKSINKSITLIVENLRLILNGEYDNKKEAACTNIMRELAYKIYVSRHRRYLTTNLGKLQFKIFMDIEYLNLFLKRIKEGYSAKEITKGEIEKLLTLLEEINDFSIEKDKIESIVNNTNKYVNRYMNKSEYSHEISMILINLSKNISSLYFLKNKSINRVYEKWERSYFDKTTYTFKEYFRKDSIRFKFAMRMAITLTFALLVGEYLGFHKIIWAIITVMSVMQPYYEDTISRSKDRVIGNVIAIIFIGILINLIDNKYVTIAILVTSLYLLYGYKEYYKISLFSAIASLCVASLSSNINELLIYRVLYVVIGVIIVMIANKIIFPYKLEDGINQLEAKINRYKDALIEEGIAYLNNEGNIHKIRDIIIHSTLMNQKLYLRNLQYANAEVDKFIYENNLFVIEVGYSILMSYGKSDGYKKRRLEKIFKVKNQ